MTAPNREAVEAAARELAKWDWDIPETHVRDAITAALPFLAPRTQPSADADEIACNLLDICPSQWPLSPRRARSRDMIAPALAAVRAQATLAGAVAEREACAKVADDFDDDPILGADIAAAIRARE